MTALSRSKWAPFDGSRGVTRAKTCSKGFVKLKDARQEVARFVFCEHFGQEPAPQ